MKNPAYVFALLLALACVDVPAQPLKIGFVNALRIENESAVTQRFIEQVKQEFAPRERELNELQQKGTVLQQGLDRDGAQMQAGERQTRQNRMAELAQQFEQMRRAYAEDLELRRREGRAQLFERVNAIIKVIGEAGNFDLIVQQAVYSAAAIDVTHLVLAELQKQAAAGGK